jgi:hypothetical protein
VITSIPKRKPITWKLIELNAAVGETESVTTIRIDPTTIDTHTGISIPRNFLKINREYVRMNTAMITAGIIAENYHTTLNAESNREGVHLGSGRVSVKNAFDCILLQRYLLSLTPLSCRRKESEVEFESQFA